MTDYEEQGAGAPKSERRRLPNKRVSELVTFQALGLEFTASASRFPTGELGELFLDPAKPGSAINTLVHEIAIAFSSAIQYGAPAADIQRALDRDSQDRPIGPLATALDKLLGRP